MPSWKTTVGRSVTVHDVYDAFGTIDWARYGATFPLVVMMASGSKTVRAYITPTLSKRAVAGLNPCSSAVVPKITDPPRFGLAAETPLRPGPFVTAPDGPSMNRRSPAAVAPMTPAATAAAG